MQLDSKEPKLSIKEFMDTETRFSMLSRLAPEEAERLLKLAQENVRKRFRYNNQLAALSCDEDPKEEAGK